jgi:hypothetical protein
METFRALLANSDSLEQFSKHRQEALRQRLARFTANELDSSEEEDDDGDSIETAVENNANVRTEIDELLKNYMDVSCFVRVLAGRI